MNNNIPQQNYIFHTNILLDQYKSAVSSYNESFSLDDFAIQYGLDVKSNSGIKRIKSGPPQLIDTNSLTKEAFSLNQMFNDINTMLEMRGEGSSPLTVGELFPYIKDMDESFRKLRNVIDCSILEVKKLLDW